MWAEVFVPCILLWVFICYEVLILGFVYLELVVNANGVGQG